MSEAPDADPSVPPVTAGELLRAARERQGMHLAVLAAALKVSPRKLELIEANRHDELPDATFVRAVALSMCRALKIDAEPVLARLPQASTNPLGPSVGLNQPFRDRGRGEGGMGADARSFLSPPVLAAVGLAAAAIAIYVLPSGLWRRDAVQAPEAASTEVLAQKTPGTDAEPLAAKSPTLPAPVAEQSAAVAADPAGAGPGASASAAGSAAVGETAVSALNAAASAPSVATVLGLRTSGESWIEVRDASGQVLLSRTLMPGESADVDGALPLRVTVGNAAATQVTFRGQPVALTASTRDNVARLELQ